MSTELQQLLDLAIRAATTAGMMIREEYHREGGPRGSGSKADIDLEAEVIIRGTLMTATPDFGYRGEETGYKAGKDNRCIWQVDPQDGTGSFLRKTRGPAVSIGLLKDRVPVLGVVYAPTAPDDNGDFFAWAEGCPFTRNGQPVERNPWPTDLKDCLLLLNPQAKDDEDLYNSVIKPAHFISRASIAYRLALVAAGEADVAVCLRHPSDYDYCGGHALLRAFGGKLVNSNGDPVRYSADGFSTTTRCIGGGPALVNDVSRMKWYKAYKAYEPIRETKKTSKPKSKRMDLFKNYDDTWSTVPLGKDYPQLHAAGPTRMFTDDYEDGDYRTVDEAIADAEALADAEADIEWERADNDYMPTGPKPQINIFAPTRTHSNSPVTVGYTVADRARGALIGQMVGDALGSQVEFVSPATLADKYPDGLRDIQGSAIWGTSAGQPTDDSELMACLAHAILRAGMYSAESAAIEYRRWMLSKPFDVGRTIGKAFRPLTALRSPAHSLMSICLDHANFDSKSNGAIMRHAALGVWGTYISSNVLEIATRHDCELSHPNIVCQDASVLFTRAIANAVKLGLQPDELIDDMAVWVKNSFFDDSVASSFWHVAARQPMISATEKRGYVLVAFQNAINQLASGANFEEAMVNTVMQGGDTDSNAAVCGALLGAVYGESGIPARWVETVMACKPKHGNKAHSRPRSDIFWPSNIARLATRLVEAGLEYGLGKG